MPSRLDDVELERRSLEQVLQRELQAVDGVADANVKVRRSRTTARVDTNRMLDTAAVETASQERLADATRRLTVPTETGRHATRQAGPLVKRDVRSTRRGDRIALALIGALLTTAAVLALLVATGAIQTLGPYVDRDEPILNARLDAALDDHQLAWQLGAVAVGLLLAILGLVWLRHQLPSPASPPRHHPRRRTTTHREHTTVDGRAFANAFEADVRRHPDVLDARADMLLDRGVVRVRLTAADDVDVERVVSDAVQPAVARLTAVADLADQPRPEIDVRLRQRDGRPLQ